MNLRRFSKINRARCESPEGFNHDLARWSPAEWTNAVAGEAGEACNAAKKLLRLRDATPGNRPGEDLETLARKTAEELCDAIVYADLAIQRLGFETSQILEFVFNRKTRQIGAPPSLLYSDKKEK